MDCQKCGKEMYQHFPIETEMDDAEWRCSCGARILLEEISIAAESDVSPIHGIVLGEGKTLEVGAPIDPLGGLMRYVDKPDA